MDSRATVTDGRLTHAIAIARDGGASRRSTTLTLTAAALAAAVTLLVSVLPLVEFAYRGPSGHIAIETAGALVPLFAAYLVWGRFRRTHRANDLTLLTALLVIAFTNAAFSAIPAIADGAPGEFATWAPLAGRTLGAALLVLAAFVPATPLSEPRRAALKAALGSGLALGGIALVVALLGERLPLAVEASLSPEGPNRPRVVGEVGVLAWLAALVALYAAAAVGFTHRAAREHDELESWVGVACVLAAFAYVNYFLYPSLYTEWVYMGDLLRLAFHLVLLVGAAREIASYQRGLAEAAVVDERRRMARDLHDGLAQELAFIGSQSKRLAARRSNGDVAPLEQLAAAADRALDESRDVISALTRPLDAPLDEALAEAVQSVAHRFDARVELDLVPGVRVSEESSAELCRIVREAVTNACRHGDCDSVRIRLTADAGVRVLVTDDGRGFDPAVRPGGGFGLTSMKERAQRIGARFTVRSEPGGGAEVEVVLP